MGVTRRKSVEASTLDLLDRSGTAPLCPDCGYRCLAIDRCRAACNRCGQIMHVQRWIVGHLLVTFAGRIIGGMVDYADRTV